jgi:hypothetical protein
MAPGLTQPLTEMSTRSLPGCKGQPVCKADNLTTICELNAEKRWEAQRLNLMGLHGLLQGYIYLFTQKNYAANLFLVCMGCPDRLWSPPISYPMGTRVSFPGGKAAGA